MLVQWRYPAILVEEVFSIHQKKKRTKKGDSTAVFQSITGLRAVVFSPGKH